MFSFIYRLGCLCYSNSVCIFHSAVVHKLLLRLGWIVLSCLYISTHQFPDVNSSLSLDRTCTHVRSVIVQENILLCPLLPLPFFYPLVLTHEGEKETTLCSLLDWFQLAVSAVAPGGCCHAIRVLCYPDGAKLYHLVGVGIGKNLKIQYDKTQYIVIFMWLKSVL